MAKWTRVLKMKSVINGRLVIAETQNSCYYRYIIFPDDRQDFSHDYKYPEKIIRSDWKYTSGIGAFSAGKSAAKKLTDTMPN